MIKGYDVPFGYMGYINGRYMLFVSEDEYLEVVRDDGN